MSADVAIDTYEPDDIKQALLDIGYVIPLETSDYYWLDCKGKTIGIERKDTGDLLSSFNTGRLSDQMSRLVDYADLPILLIEGIISQGSDGLVKIWQNGGQLTREYPYWLIQEMLLEAQLSGVFLLFTTSKNSTKLMIRRLYEWSQREEHNLLNRRKRPFQLGTKVDRQKHLLMGLPGVGEETASGLIDEFGGPLAAMAGIVMEPKQAMRVKGMGKTKIERAREVLLPKQYE